jgi:hypothetical protein
MIGQYLFPADRKHEHQFFSLYLEKQPHKSQEFLRLNASYSLYPDPVKTGNKCNANNGLQLGPENVFAE